MGGWTVFLDGQKATGTIPHKELVEKPAFQTGIGGDLLQWTKIYLSEKEQWIHVRSTISK